MKEEFLEEIKRTFQRTIIIIINETKENIAFFENNTVGMKEEQEERGRREGRKESAFFGN